MRRTCGSMGSREITIVPCLIGSNPVSLLGGCLLQVMRKPPAMEQAGPRWLLLECLVIPRLKLSEETVLIEREMLGQRDGDDSFLRVDLAIGRGSAVPAELANGGWHGELSKIGRHLDAESKAFLPCRGLIVG